MGLFDLFKRQRPEESRINKSYNSSTDTSSREETLLIEKLEHEILYDIFQTTGEKEKLEGLMEKQKERLMIEAEECEEKKLGNSIGMEFVKIPAGEFMMGSDEDIKEHPVHKVTIPAVFYMGKYPVTQKQWIAVMGDDPSLSKGDDKPVERVSWNDVQEFINRLNKKEGTNKYRLPSEAEWEYGCRAGKTTRYSFGSDEEKLGEYGWYDDKSTHPVGKKKPNPWGLYDMHGNVWEWCQDKWHCNYNGAPTDGSAWETGSASFRVNRGGSWNFNARKCRSASRYNLNPDYGNCNLGFRLLRET